jgi:hypothetical protein
VIDRQFIGGSWNSQRDTHSALRFLGLVDAESKPTDDLHSLANSDETGRREIYRALVERCYAGALELGPKATQTQLEAWFRRMGANGDSARKAQSFFVSLAKAGGIEVSPFFKSTRAAPSTPRKRIVKRSTPKPTNPGSAESTPTKPSVDDRHENIHPSIMAVLDKIPKQDQRWTAAERDLLVETFKGLLMLFHPVADEPKAAEPNPDKASATDSAAGQQQTTPS